MSLTPPLGATVTSLNKRRGMSLGILILGVDKPQNNATLGQKSGPGLLIKKLPKNSMAGGQGNNTLRLSKALL